LPLSLVLSFESTGYKKCQGGFDKGLCLSTWKGDDVGRVWTRKHLATLLEGIYTSVCLSLSPGSPYLGPSTAEMARTDYSLPRLCWPIVLVILLMANGGVASTVTTTVSN